MYSNYFYHYSGLKKVGLMDLSGYECEPYFFNDATHFSGKGWAIINEELVKFYQK